MTDSKLREHIEKRYAEERKELGYTEVIIHCSDCMHSAFQLDPDGIQAMVCGLSKQINRLPVSLNGHCNFAEKRR